MMVHNEILELIFPIIGHNKRFIIIVKQKLNKTLFFIFSLIVNNIPTLASADIWKLKLLIANGKKIKIETKLSHSLCSKLFFGNFLKVKICIMLLIKIE